MSVGAGGDPYVVHPLSVATSAWSNRCRALVILASMLAAYAGYNVAEELGSGNFAVRAVFTAFAVLVPFNVLLALAFPEPGVRQHRNYRCLLLGLPDALVVISIAGARVTTLPRAPW